MGELTAEAFKYVCDNFSILKSENRIRSVQCR